MRPLCARGRLRSLGSVVLLFVSYYLLAEWGLQWASIRGVASPIFPAAGLALAGLVLGGLWLWPVVFVATFIAVVQGTDLSLWVVSGIAGGNALAAWVGAWSLRRARVKPALPALRDVLGLLRAAVVAATITATIGLVSLSLASVQWPHHAGITWVTWWAGDSIGILVITPLLCAWAGGGPLPRGRVWLHLLASSLASGVATWVIFGPLDVFFGRAFLVFPTLIWASLTSGVRGATMAMLPVWIVALSGTSQGYGPFAVTETSIHQPALHFVLLQQFVAVATLTALVIAVIADERRGKEALRESEERFRNVADNAPVMMWMTARDGQCTYVNKLWCEFSGQPEAMALGFGWLEAVHPEDAPRARDIFLAANDAKQPFRLEYRVRRSDGAYRWCIDTAAPRIDAHGELLGYVGSVIDITDRKESEEERAQLLAAEQAARSEAERASRLKDEFLSTVSHELRTPLTAILGWTHILSNRLNSSEDHTSRALTVIDRNARALAQLVEDLLDMSRILSGKLRFDMQPVDPYELVGAALASVAPSAERKGVRLEKDLPAGVGIVRGDPSRLQQVVWNLLSNAIKFTPSGGRVCVSLHQDEDRLEIDVADTGQGIPADFLPHVFDRFRQADASTTRRHGGLGLGLSIVKNIVELHGGAVRASSAGVGRGSTFSVSLPLVGACSDAEWEAHRSAGGASETALEGISVLVVDDIPDACEMVKRLLEERGAKVRTAGSGEEAQRQIERERPDVLVSDIGMPGMDGYELIRHVRALPKERGGDVPAVALTALARTEDRTRALGAGFQVHVAKPVQPLELMAAIGALLKGRAERTNPPEAALCPKAQAK